MPCNDGNADPHFEAGLERAGLAVFIAKPGMSELKQSDFSKMGLLRTSQ